MVLLHLCSCMSHTICFDVSLHKVELRCPRVFLSEAGVMLVSEGRTADGFERHFGVNYLGHFLLTWLLLDTLKDCGKCGSFSRVVSVSSSAHRVGEIGPSGPDIWYVHACTTGQSEVNGASAGAGGCRVSCRHGRLSFLCCGFSGVFLISCQRYWRRFNHIHAAATLRTCQCEKRDLRQQISSVDYLVKPGGLRLTSM